MRARPKTFRFYSMRPMTIPEGTVVATVDGLRFVTARAATSRRPPWWARLAAWIACFVRNGDGGPEVFTGEVEIVPLENRRSARPIPDLHWN